jgi:hypothetical protein
MVLWNSGFMFSLNLWIFGFYRYLRKTKILGLYRCPPVGTLGSSDSFVLPDRPSGGFRGSGGAKNNSVLGVYASRMVF